MIHNRPTGASHETLPLMEGCNMVLQCKFISGTVQQTTSVCCKEKLVLTECSSVLVLILFCTGLLPFIPFILGFSALHTLHVLSTLLCVGVLPFMYCCRLKMESGKQ